MRAQVLFWKEAASEYVELDGSQQQWVDAAVRRLELRGFEMGKHLPACTFSLLAGFQQVRNTKLRISLTYCAAQNGEIEVIQMVAEPPKD